MFESSVIPSGSKTRRSPQLAKNTFESSVIPSGSKTSDFGTTGVLLFESSVIPSGSKTHAGLDHAAKWV